MFGSKELRRRIATILCAIFMITTVLTIVIAGGKTHVFATEGTETNSDKDAIKNGGGYAVTGQLKDVGYATYLYNATNGLPTSDANCVLASREGYIYIGGYSGVIKYDGTTFERLDSKTGLTSGKALFEDKNGRIFVGTNDNGVVIIDGEDMTHITYKEGLPSSTIRGFTDGDDDIIYVGTTSGIAYFDKDLNLHNIDDSRINNAYIIKMTYDRDGITYANTRAGDLICLKGDKVIAFYSEGDMPFEKITTVYADQGKSGYLYLGTEENHIYYGNPSKGFDSFEKIDVSPLSHVMNIAYVSGRIVIICDDKIGYLDGKVAKVIDNIPLNSGIENVAEDYQGNLWFTSSRQGVMKIVTNNFKDLTEEAGLPHEVVNTTCLFNNELYVGTDKGLQVMDLNGKAVTNKLTNYIGGARIRCMITAGNDLYVAVYNNGFGLVKYSYSGEITSYNEDNGFINNGVRCLKALSDGSVMAGTNGGVAIIKDGEIVKTITEKDGLGNTVVLTVEETGEGLILIGTDGGGIYVVDGDNMKVLGRDDGLTSDVILRIKYDEKRKVSWIVTSNSIQYYKDGVIKEVSTFPYSNNYDIYFDNNDNLWILASYGIYCVKAETMLEDKDLDYKFYDTANGLSSVPTGNGFSALDKSGNLYIAGRTGVTRVNINNYYEQSSVIKIGIKAIYCDDVKITPNEDGVYEIPPETNRMQIFPAVINYTLTDPLIYVFFEGDQGLAFYQSNMVSLEYTEPKFGDYTLHVQILDGSREGLVLSDEVFSISKKPTFFERPIVKGIGLLLIIGFVGFLVWWIMTSTIIRRQYDEISAAKDEAERANTAKSRFIANISHEIRTPINTILGMDEMILREDGTGVPKPYYMSMINYALDIRRATESLLGLVNDVLDLSKIESGKMNLVEQDYDTAELLRAITSMIRVKSDEKALKFTVSVDENVPKKLYGDMGKIKQVVLNLLTNAVKYTEKGGFELKLILDSINEPSESLTNAGENEEGESALTCNLRFEVQDTGIGIKPEDMDKLFTAFERLDEKKNSGIQGTGLGLNISHQFAMLMHGDLTCESEYGKGTKFIFKVTQRIVDKEPIGTFEEKAMVTAQGPYVPKFIAPKAKVLIVDDDQMNRTVISGLLSSTKVKISIATGGKECLEMIDKEHFDVVLLDHMMPEMDGIETIGHIREKYKDLKVFALTANAATNGEEYYKSAGFDGYLAKPINTETLELTLKANIDPSLIEEAAADDEDEDMTFPPEYAFLEETEGITTKDGIRNSGGVSSYINAINLFTDTIEDNADVIEKAYKDEDINMYTIKVHALKSSARIIGANILSELAKSLEDAGNKRDMELIHAKTKELLDMYRGFKEKLKAAKTEEDVELADIDQDELQGAYDALKEIIPQMDYDSVEMVLTQVQAYKLPDKDKEFFKKLAGKLKTFDWDGMEELIKTVE